jgi:hypothetical protein
MSPRNSPWLVVLAIVLVLAAIVGVVSLTTHVSRGLTRHDCERYGAHAVEYFTPASGPAYPPVVMCQKDL